MAFSTPFFHPVFILNKMENKKLNTATREDIGYNRALKDVLGLIDEFDIKRFLIRKERDIRKWNPFHPQVIAEKIKFELKARIEGGIK